MKSFVVCVCEDLISAGVVEEMVCCEIDGDRAYCEMSEASCSNNQIMGGILQKNGELQNNCCYLTDKITGKKLSVRSFSSFDTLLNSWNPTDVADI